MTNMEEVDKERMKWLEGFMERTGFSNQQVADLFFGTHHAISQYRRGVRRTSKRLIACAKVWEKDAELWMSIRDEVQERYKRNK